MNIGSVSRGAVVERLRTVGAYGNDVSQPRSVTDTAVDGQGVKVSLSKPVEMMSRLEALKKRDPDAFEQTLSDSSAQLRRAAEKTEGPGGEQLAALASRFAQAATSGDVAGLQPPPREPAVERPVTGQAGRALAAYAQNTPARTRSDESVERAASDAFVRIEQAARAASTTNLTHSTLGPSLYA